MRVVLVSGSAPPAICGVGDYTALLSDALRQLGCDCTVYVGADWAWARRREVRDEILALRPDLVHIQFPTRGYEGSLVPSWLCRALRTVPTAVTLHEYRSLVGKPRLGLVPRGLKTFFPFTTAKVLIFSSHNERDAIAGWAPWIWRRSVVIPIGSTIPAGNGIKTDSVLVHFGQIAPGKGLEDFLELARNGADSTVKYVLIGGLPAGEREYQAAILSGLERNSVDLVLNQPPHVVADMLSAARYAYLPFPDGASAKRTTLLTALINKLVVLTTHGPETPDWVRSVTVRANSPEEAGEALLRFEREILKREALMKKIEATLERFSWPFIAEQHVDIYRRVLSSRNGLRLSPR